MDLDRTYKNRKLESRRKWLLRTQEADAILRRRKDRRSDGRAQIVAVFEGGGGGGGAGGPLYKLVRRAVNRKDPGRTAFRDALRRVLLRVDAESYLLNDLHNAAAVVRLARAHGRWLRPPEDWVARSHNARRQIASLARHLLARYDVPAFMDAAWSLDDEACRLHQQWFIHVGGGGNIRTADGLPVPLTKRMAHHFLLAPDECTIPQAVRWGQLRGVGAGERVTRAVLGSRVGCAFAPPEQEAFWATVFQWLVLHPMIDPHQVGPVIDYLHHQKFVPAGPVNVGNGTFVEQGPPQPGLSMKGRTPGALVAQVEAWHRQLGRAHARGGGSNVSWKPCGVGGYDRVEGEPGNQRRFFITELLSGAELRAEGAAMKHCVGTYTASCQSGRTAIFSLKVDGGFGAIERRVTIEVDVRNRQITQVRAKHNAASTPLDQRVLNAWATTARLGFSRFALSRAY